MDFANAVTLRKIQSREEDGPGDTFPSVNPAHSELPGSRGSTRLPYLLVSIPSLPSALLIHLLRDLRNSHV